MANKLFQDKNGNTSSKRVAGYLLITIGILAYFLKGDLNATMFFCGAGGSLLGIGVFER